MYTAEKD